MQLGSLLRSSRRRGPDVWEFRYRERPHNGRRYEVPAPQELPKRLGAVLQVIYLVFSEGYSAAAGAEVTRAELTDEAIRLVRLLTDLQPEPEVMWAALPDVAARIPSRRSNLSDQRADFAGESKPLALEPKTGRRGSGWRKP